MVSISASQTQRTRVVETARLQRAGEKVIDRLNHGILFVQ